MTTTAQCIFLAIGRGRSRILGQGPFNFQFPNLFKLYFPIFSRFFQLFQDFVIFYNNTWILPYFLDCQNFINFCLVYSFTTIYCNLMSNVFKTCSSFFNIFFQFFQVSQFDLGSGPPQMLNWPLAIGQALVEPNMSC